MAYCKYAFDPTQNSFCVPLYDFQETNMCYLIPEITTTIGMNNIDTKYYFQIESSDIWQFNERDTINKWVYPPELNAYSQIYHNEDELKASTGRWVRMQGLGWSNIQEAPESGCNEPIKCDLAYKLARQFSSVITYFFASGQTAGGIDIVPPRKFGMNILIRIKDKFFKYFRNENFWEIMEDHPWRKNNNTDSEYCFSSYLPTIDNPQAAITIINSEELQNGNLLLELDASNSFFNYTLEIYEDGVRGTYPYPALNKMYYDWGIYGVNPQTKEMEEIAFALNSSAEVNFDNLQTISVIIPNNSLKCKTGLPIRYEKVVVLLKTNIYESTLEEFATQPIDIDGVWMFDANGCWEFTYLPGADSSMGSGILGYFDLTQEEVDRILREEQVDPTQIYNFWTYWLLKTVAVKADWAWEEIPLTAGLGESGGGGEELPSQLEIFATTTDGPIQIEIT